MEIKSAKFDFVSQKGAIETSRPHVRVDMNCGEKIFYWIPESKKFGDTEDEFVKLWPMHGPLCGLVNWFWMVGWCYEQDKWHDDDSGNYGSCCWIGQIGAMSTLLREQTEGEYSVKLKSSYELEMQLIHSFQPKLQVELQFGENIKLIVLRSPSSALSTETKKQEEVVIHPPGVCNAALTRKEIKEFKRREIVLEYTRNKKYTTYKHIWFDAPGSFWSDDEDIDHYSDEKIKTYNELNLSFDKGNDHLDVKLLAIDEERRRKQKEERPDEGDDGEGDGGEGDDGNEYGDGEGDEYEYDEGDGEGDEYGEEIDGH